MAPAKTLYPVFTFFILVLFHLSFQEKPVPYTQTGEASYYAGVLEGNITANGEIYAGDSLTAAHRTLPFGTLVKVTNLNNHKKVMVKINDRGPFLPGRIIDLSRKAAKKLGMLKKGVTEVKLEVVMPAPGYTVSDSTTITY